MFRDSQTALWEAAALTATAVSTNAYDCGAPFTSGGTAIDPSVGEPLVAIITVGVAADHTTGDETYEFDLITATASDLTTGQKIVEQRVLLFSQLTLGSVHQIPIPSGSIDQRFIGLKYIGGGTTPTVTVTAWIAPASMFQKTRDYSTAIIVN